MAIYITENQNPNPNPWLPANIKTSKISDVSVGVASPQNISNLVDELKHFNQNYADLFRTKRADLYRSFHIPKSSGGLRRIDAPSPEISEALNYLKTLFETRFVPYAHEAAYAYVKKRRTVDAIKQHQENQSRHFLKLDFSNFFGNSTFEFILSALRLIYPFSEVVKQKDGKLALEKALELCFLNGSLPQGSPISPYLTNLMMIPIDFEICATLKRINKNKRFIYTRYADDMLISCAEGFNPEKIEAEINKILLRFKAPFPINQKKTRYGSSAGSNWNLGMMLNGKNEITIGHQKKRQFKAMLDNYIKHRAGWGLHDVQVLQGHINYFNSIEPDYIRHVISQYDLKRQVNIKQMIYSDLKTKHN